MKLDINNKGGQQVKAPKTSPNKKPVVQGGANSTKDLRTGK